ncbi:hypothetical protein ND00_19680 [Clostridium sp. L74]|nr:hypothetical protein ND00_19680 [Clostridium sp. L74]
MKYIFSKFKNLFRNSHNRIIIHCSAYLKAMVSNKKIVSFFISVV